MSPNFITLLLLLMKFGIGSNPGTGPGKLNVVTSTVIQQLINLINEYRLQLTECSCADKSQSSFSRISLGSVKKQFKSTKPR
jgi:hypothetical protein